MWKTKPFLKCLTHDCAWRQGQIIDVFFLEDFASTPAILVRVLFSIIYKVIAWWLNSPKLGQLTAEITHPKW